MQLRVVSTGGSLVDDGQRTIAPGGDRGGGRGVGEALHGLGNNHRIASSVPRQNFQAPNVRATWSRRPASRSVSTGMAPCTRIGRNASAAPAERGAVRPGVGEQRAKRDCRAANGYMSHRSSWSFPWPVLFTRSIHQGNRAFSSSVAARTAQTRESWHSASDRFILRTGCSLAYAPQWRWHWSSPGLAAFPLLSRTISRRSCTGTARSHRWRSQTFPAAALRGCEEARPADREVTASRFMPPWLPQPGYGDFAGELRLSDAEIQRIARAQPGRRRGPPRISRRLPTSLPVGCSVRRIWCWKRSGRSWFRPTGRTCSGTSYLPQRWPRPATCGRSRFVRAIRGPCITPISTWTPALGATEETGHGAGFAGMDPDIEHNAFDPGEGHFLFWKPGSPPYVDPDGLAWRLEPGTDRC